jgi:ADP-ribosyl-[dinitrogen reductase] hydrolase
VTAVAGALTGAVHGVAAVPARWASAVHGRLPGRGPGAPERPVRLAELQELAAALDGRALVPHEDGALARLGPVEVADGVWAANLAGARCSDRDFAVVSLCRVGEPFGHEVQRLVHLLDTEHNSGLDAVLADVLDDVAALRAEGRRVLVHCHGGASRTGLVLRAWLRRTRGLSPAEATAAVAARWPHLGTWNDSFTAALERMTP